MIEIESPEHAFEVLLEAIFITKSVSQDIIEAHTKYWSFYGIPDWLAYIINKTKPEINEADTVWIIDEILEWLYLEHDIYAYPFVCAFVHLTMANAAGS